MNLKENFKQATQELFSSPKADVAVPTPTASAPTSERVMPEAPLPFASNRQTSLERTVIAAGTRIVGSITTESDITVEGSVDGDVISSGDVKIVGGVMGNIEGYNCDISSGITGDIKCTDRITINEECTVNGDLEGKNIEIFGRVVGNVTADEELRIFKNSSIKGDIVSGPVSMESGAVVSGNLQIKSRA